MKKIFLAAISIVCLMASCTKDEIQADPINTNEGKEVVFSSSIGEATRTLYAEENGNKIAVKWVDGDLISVYGSTCAVNQSDYTVKAATGTETPGGVSTNYYYAESLTKTGTTGVQWGNEETSDFYAVYPSVGDNQFTKVDGGVKVQTTVRPQQNVTFAYNSTTKTWVGQHYNGAASNPTMTDAVMYAYTAGATSGEQVDLKFKPFSTVLRFTFKGFKAIKSSGEIDTEYNTSTVAVNKIVLTAPNTKIAGDFALTINEDGTASATEGTSNTIEIYPDYLPMKNNEQLQFDIFTIPTANVMPQAAEQAWKVQVVTEKGTFTFNMVPKTVTTPTNAPVAGLALTTGALHKLTIPLKEVKFDFDIPANNWIRYIPRNVYLSELSVPGAWYAGDLATYHGGATLDQLYSDGVRAFHIDCRVSYDSVSKDRFSSNHSYSETLTLVSAGTESSQASVGLLSKLTYSQGVSVKSVIESLISMIKSDEYMVVVLTIAEKPMGHDYGTGFYPFGTIDPATVLSYINTMVSELQTTHKHTDGSPVVYNKKIDANTTVKDVLGHLIIKVNSNAQEEYSSTASDGTVTKSGFTTYNSVPNLLISAASMASNADYITGDIFGSSGSHAVANLFTAMQTEPMYWGKTPLMSGDEPLNFYYHQCQRTEESETASSGTTIPSLYDRKLAIDDIVAMSETIYKKNTHSAWYQIGVGGYTFEDGIISNSTHQDVVANSLNPYLEKIVTAKLNQTEFTRTNGTTVVMSPSPVGIVLMNFAHTTGLGAVKAILEMNTKFYLNRDHDANYGEWPDGNPFETSGDSGTDGGGSGGNDDGQQGEV